MNKRYIDADELLKRLPDHLEYKGAVKRVLIQAPEADVAEVRHGEWKAYADEHEICATEFECSCCREAFSSSELTDEEFFQMMKYCPECGAKMDGERSENGKS